MSCHTDKSVDVKFFFNIFYFIFIFFHCKLDDFLFTSKNGTLQFFFFVKLHVMSYLSKVLFVKMSVFQSFFIFLFHLLQLFIVRNLLLTN